MIATNFFIVGVALQLGGLQVSAAAVERAIELNGVQLDFNRRALHCVRLCAYDAPAVERLLGTSGPASLTPATPTLDDEAARGVQRLTDDQDSDVAQRSGQRVTRVRAAERRASGAAGPLSLVAVAADRIRGLGQVKHAEVQAVRAAWQAHATPTTVPEAAPARQAA